MRCAVVIFAITLFVVQGALAGTGRLKGRVSEGATGAGSGDVEAKTEYVIRMGGPNGARWHSNEGGDRRVSTKFHTDDSYSRFHIERTAPDVFRIRVAGTGRILHGDDLTTRRVSTHFGRVGDRYSVVIALRNGNGTWSFRTKASKHWWFLGHDDFLMTNPTPQPNSSFWIHPDPSNAPMAADRSTGSHAAWQRVMPGRVLADVTGMEGVFGSGILDGLRDRAASRRLSAKSFFVGFLEFLLFWALPLGDTAGESAARVLALLNRRDQGGGGAGSAGAAHGRDGA